MRAYFFLFLLLFATISVGQVKSDVLVLAPGFDEECYSYDSGLRSLSVSLTGVQDYITGLGFNGAVYSQPLTQDVDLKALMSEYKLTVLLSCSDLDSMTSQQVQQVRDFIAEGNPVIVDAFNTPPLLSEFGFSVESERLELESSVPTLIARIGEIPSSYYSDSRVAEYRNAYVFNEVEQVLFLSNSSQFSSLPEHSRMYYFGPSLKEPPEANLLLTLKTDAGLDDSSNRLTGGVLFLSKLSSDQSTSFVVTGCFFCMNEVLFSSLIDYLPDKDFDFPRVRLTRLVDPQTAYVGQVIADRVQITFDASAEFERVNIEYVTDFVCSALNAESKAPSLVSELPITYVVNYKVLSVEDECTLPPIRVSMEARVNDGAKTLRREFVIPQTSVKLADPTITTSTTNRGQEQGSILASPLTWFLVLAAVIVLIGVGHYFLVTKKKQPLREKSDRIQELLKHKTKVKDVMDLAKAQWYKRHLDDSAFKNIFEENTKKLLEINAELKQLGYTQEQALEAHRAREKLKQEEKEAAEKKRQEALGEKEQEDPKDDAEGLDFGEQKS